MDISGLGSGAVVTQWLFRHSLTEQRHQCTDGTAWKILPRERTGRFAKQLSSTQGLRLCFSWPTLGQEWLVHGTGGHDTLHPGLQHLWPAPGVEPQTGFAGE